MYLIYWGSQRSPVLMCSSSWFNSMAGEMKGWLWNKGEDGKKVLFMNNLIQTAVVPFDIADRIHSFNKCATQMWWWKHQPGGQWDIQQRDPFRLNMAILTQGCIGCRHCSITKHTRLFKERITHILLDLQRELHYFFFFQIRTWKKVCFDRY